MIDAARTIAAPVASEAAWRRHLAARGTVALDLDGIVGAAARLVVVAPHPDDEVLACGGLIRAHALRGGRVVVVGVSDGEASHAEDAPAARRARAAQRRIERVDGLAALGVGSRDIRRLGFADGAIAASSDALEARLAGLFCATDTVVSTWRLDGHPDHEATGTATAGACRATGCRFVEAPVWMWHWAALDDARVDWNRTFAFRLDAATRRAKARALRAHASQLEPRDAQTPPVLDPAIVERAARDAEYFFELGTPRDGAAVAEPAALRRPHEAAAPL